ncbi:hypothetical protein B9Z55_002048 [Caenorhabditis nigoni]|uniref:Uncharacterized protein n=1 Tax=Caenorhabditis nigoni TaxID=1611254 RepID=A0A2G5VIU7_9PELO|nr:hypothetical protein B9Z55_002048 [Caenorhabditis nigoni]
MAHVESFYLDSNLESDAAALPITENDMEIANFIADLPLNDDNITRIVNSQLHFEKKNQVTSDYCVEAQELEMGSQANMSTSILDNQKYFALPNTDKSQYAWHPTDAISSHHQYAAQSPNIYTNDYMTSEPSDYVYM